MNRFRFSVLMSVYVRENASNLDAALTSVFDQSLPPSEVVLVADGPLTRPLEAVISRFSARPDFRLVRLPQNMGLGAALNAGLEACSHDIVARMDSDDISVRQRFALQMARFMEEPDLSAIGSSIAEFVHDPAHVERTKIVPSTHDQIAKRFTTRCPINHPTVVYRKADVLRCGGYTHEYMQEDYHLWGKMIASGCRFANLPEPLVLMRTGQGLYKRRGGLRYAWSEAKLQAEFWRMGLLSTHRFVLNSAGRGFVRILPGRLREFLYTRLLRHKSTI